MCAPNKGVSLKRGLIHMLYGRSTEEEMGRER